MTAHCSHYLTEENIDGDVRLIAAAVALQVADVHAKCAREEDVRKLFHSKLDVSVHPKNGQRLDIDDMLNVIDQMFVPPGRNLSPFMKQEFEYALRFGSVPWLQATLSGIGLTAVLPEYPGGPPVAFLSATAETQHPQLGAGALLRLSFPLELTADEAAALAHKLNLAEAREHTKCHGYGAWCWNHEDGGIAFVTFLPATVYRSGLLDKMILNEAMRIKWAMQLLS